MKTGSAVGKCVKIMIQKLLCGLSSGLKVDVMEANFFFSQHNLIPKTKGKQEKFPRECGLWEG